MSDVTREAQLEKTIAALEDERDELITDVAERNGMLRHVKGRLEKAQARIAEIGAKREEVVCGCGDILEPDQGARCANCIVPLEFDADLGRRLRAVVDEGLDAGGWTAAVWEDRLRAARHA